MSAPYRIVPRTEIGLDPVVRNSNGSPRSKVVTPAVYVTHHWTGVNVRWGDVGDTPSEILGIQAYAQKAGKPDEYNYVNHQDPDNLIFEYAGHYRAAHSAGENGIAFGVLHLVGTQELITLQMVDKIKWLNEALRYGGQTNFQTEQRGHKRMPGAATACPGDQIMWWMSEFDKPSSANVTPTPPPPPPVKPPVKPPVPVQPPDSGKYGLYLVTDGTTPWGISAETYGTGTKWETIVEANAPDKTPNPGERWLVPGFEGRMVEVKPGEGPINVLNRVFGSDGWNKKTGVDEFWQWNGGDPEFGGRRFNGKYIALQPGEKVWVRS